MRYEVEQKFPVESLKNVQERLIALGGNISEAQSELDVYYSHPARDFSETDEALRLRQKGEKVFITYKGPKIDRETKTRHEIDLPLPEGKLNLRSWQELLIALGFHPVGEVHKRRKKAKVQWEGEDVECSLDHIEALGSFVELELVVESEGLERAKKCIASLAEELQLHQSERRSYLELILEQG